MSSLFRRVHRTIQLRRLLADGDRVAVAISGGPDSVALVLVLHDLASDAAWRVAGLIHVNHGLRGAAADADERFCRDLADRLGLPIDVAQVSTSYWKIAGAWTRMITSNCPGGIGSADM